MAQLPYFRFGFGPAAFSFPPSLFWLLLFLCCWSQILGATGSDLKGATGSDKYGFVKPPPQKTWEDALNVHLQVGKDLFPVFGGIGLSLGCLHLFFHSYFRFSARIASTLTLYGVWDIVRTLSDSNMQINLICIPKLVSFV